MWEKNFRVALFTAVYQKLFQSDFVDAGIAWNWEIVLNNLKVEEASKMPKVQDLSCRLEDLGTNQEKYQNLLQKYLQSWDRTYDIVKAILLTYLQELSEMKESGSLEVNSNEIVSKYIRLTQEYIGGENTALVHAVASNILENNLAEV